MAGQGETDPEPDLEEVLALVANETRMEILRALWEARNADESPLGFSALQDRTAVRDGGRFNYHLDRLVPRFVRKHGSEDGYALTYAGERVIGDAVSGGYTAVGGTEVAPTPVVDCPDPDCPGTVEARYEAGRAVFDCDSCDRHPDTVSAPPIVVEAHGPDRMAAASRFSLVTIERAVRGFCPLCDGPIESSIARLTPGYEPVLEDAVDVVHECGACGYARRSGAVTTLIGHPAVVALLHEAGVDYRTAPHWEQTWLTGATERLAGEEPPRVTVTTTIGGRERTFTLDGDLAVVES
jgi:hypothetical protein